MINKKTKAWILPEGFQLLRSLMSGISTSESIKLGWLMLGSSISLYRSLNDLVALEGVNKWLVFCVIFNVVLIGLTLRDLLSWLSINPAVAVFCIFLSLSLDSGEIKSFLVNLFFVLFLLYKLESCKNVLTTLGFALIGWSEVI